MPVERMDRNRRRSILPDLRKECSVHIPFSLAHSAVHRIPVRQNHSV